MKFGIREICDVVFRAKAKMKVGNRVFYKHEPVIYFDSLKTSTLEGAATTVYAQGGRGNARLAAWEGERTVTFTMEDALISTLGLSILTGAGVVDAEEIKDAEGNVKGIIQHVTETVLVNSDNTITLENPPYMITSADGTAEHSIYVMKLDDHGNVESEPYIYTGTKGNKNISILTGDGIKYQADTNAPAGGDTVLVDYYVQRTAKAQQITITADKFGGNFYVEASTLFRDAGTGVDMPAEFIIPNAKVQSNFTFTMASSGDPSTFTFTMDAFPDYTRFDKTEKVFSAIQIITDATSDDYYRIATDATESSDNKLDNADTEDDITD